jgi:hypothetical protein
MAANARITGFLSGHSPHSEGRYLSAIPFTISSSGCSSHRAESPPDAPVLDAETIAEIRLRPELQEAVRESLAHAWKSQAPAYHADPYSAKLRVFWQHAIR